MRPGQGQGLEVAGGGACTGGGSVIAATLSRGPIRAGGGSTPGTEAGGRGRAWECCRRRICRAEGGKHAMTASGWLLGPAGHLQHPRGVKALV